MDTPDYIVEISGLPDLNRGSPQTSQSQTQKGLSGRRWLAVKWSCCHAYSRAYRNAAGTAYEGRCPSCGKTIRVKIGPEGVSSRFFEAY